MSTKLYMWTLGAVCASVVLGVVFFAGLRHRAQQPPSRPPGLPEFAIWRPTPAEEFATKPHGDWIACWYEAQQDRCRLTDADGAPEYDGVFTTLPEAASVTADRLDPIVSETISAWMWSSQAGRQVPMIQLKDGTVLAPAGSGADLSSYVAKVRKVNARLKPLPLYAQFHRPSDTQ